VEAGTDVTDYAFLFLRAWLMVALVAVNTIQIARRQMYRAMAVGYFISLIWWFNAHSASVSGTAAGFIYAAGAALGTFTGIKIAGKG
jgi:hypothetical protein